MKEIIENYIETSFDGFEQSKSKSNLFKNNYKKKFLTDKFDKVLDIGVGRGEMLSCMKEWGLNYQGIDISPSTIKFCQSLKLNCEIVDDTIIWLHKNREEFKIITCLDVLEHIPKNETIEFLKAIRSSLKRDGKAIIQVPNLQSPFGYLHHFNDFTHLNGYVEHSLAQVLLAAKFERFEFFGFEEINNNNYKESIRIGLRWAFRKVIRILRAINLNPNPKILDPVMYVIAYK